jgi:glutathione synthase/RimK-type ligase-like ATP-grasp enzyme
VVKPLVSASAWRTFVTETGTAVVDERAWRELLGGSDGMVQEFIPEVQTAGEWSLIFFGGAFSHAVLKRPRAGDFRVQAELGGTAVLAEPPGALLDGARKVLALVEEPLLFARVDGVERNGGFLLMELELIEPQLFLGADVGAPARFADAIVAVL